MRSKFLATAFVLALLATLQIVGPSRAADNQTLSAAPQPEVSKMTIKVGDLPTVYYNVQNGTPRLNAVYRLLQFAENEYTLVKQLQDLKFDYVRNERIREAQTLAGGVGNSSTSYGYYSPPGESTLKQGLSNELAAEGTPEAAVRAIELLEKAETDAANELKLLTPQDRQQLQETTKKLQDFAAAHGAKAVSATNGAK
ncbi:MAG TPA: hypothetical protein VGZ47_17350 [Gemmataceae bacterium]|jgi:hypothetical protein|nr:hypothetical protein [Gemmataceae bacterium]